MSLISNKFLIGFICGFSVVCFLIMRDLYIKSRYKANMEYLVSLLLVQLQRLNAMGEDTHFEEALVYEILRRESLNISEELLTNEQRKGVL